MSNLTIPKKLEPIVRAFYANSPKTAKALIIQAAKAIYCTDTGPFSFERAYEITPEELESICVLVQSINPQDTLEALCASQIVVSHMLGLRKLAKDNLDDQRIGLQLIRLSNDAINQLQKKRSGASQNITVTYNHSGDGPALVQNVLSDPKQE